MSGSVPWQHRDRWQSRAQSPCFHAGVVQQWESVLNGWQNPLRAGAQGSLLWSGCFGQNFGFWRDIAASRAIKICILGIPYGNYFSILASLHPCLLGLFESVLQVSALHHGELSMVP